MSTLAEIEAQLSEPFALDDIDFLPKGKIEKEGKTLCMALPYADPRVYQDRLNALCPGEWSTPTPTALTVGNKLVCYVTVVICGVPHSDVGEADPGENQGTEAWAQAFKRACSQAGLGRYLYNLEKEWVPFNTQRKMIDLDKAGKAAIVKKMYQKAGITTGQAPQPTTKPALHVVANDPAPSEITAPVPSKLRTMFVSIGTTLETAQKLTFKGVIKNDGDLTPEECFTLHQVYDAWKKRHDEKAAVGAGK